MGVILGLYGDIRAYSLGFGFRGLGFYRLFSTDKMLTRRLSRVKKWSYSAEADGKEHGSNMKTGFT